MNSSNILNIYIIFNNIINIILFNLIILLYIYIYI